MQNLSSYWILQKIRNKFCFLPGDFNLNLLKIDEHSQTIEFYNLLMTRHFFSVISRPTRITKFSATLIDNIFVIVTSCSLTNTIIYYDVSDHLPIFLQADISGKTCKQSADLRKKRFFKQESITKFVKLLLLLMLNLVG